MRPGVNWRDEDASHGRVAFRMTGFASELEADLPKLRRKRGIQDGVLDERLAYRKTLLMGLTVAPPAIISAGPS
jgi:hypothetical protein